MVSTHREKLGGENDDLSATVNRIWIRIAEKGNSCQCEDQPARPSKCNESRD